MGNDVDEASGSSNCSLELSFLVCNEVDKTSEKFDGGEAKGELVLAEEQEDSEEVKTEGRKEVQDEGEVA